jgi:hypothetical protein
LTVGCGHPDATIDTTFNPCSGVPVSSPDATVEEREAVRAAIEGWNKLGMTHLEVASAAEGLLVQFEDGPAFFHGVYDDENGRITVNRALEQGQPLAVTVAHELGHAMGLEHVETEDRASVMNRGNTQLMPTPEDYSALFAQWNHCRSD